MKEHHWSGWPGAYCLHCGSEDPQENALALGWVVFEYENGTHREDPTGYHFDTPEHEQKVKDAMICPVGFSEKCGQCIHLDGFDE